MSAQLNIQGIMEVSEALHQAGRLPGDGKVDPKYRLKRLVDARNVGVRLSPRERAAALFLATVRLQPELGSATNQVVNLFNTFLSSRK